MTDGLWTVPPGGWPATVTSSAGAIIEPCHLQVVAMGCDVSSPHDVSTIILSG